MAKVKATGAPKTDVGKSRQPILDSLNHKFRGAAISYYELPCGGGSIDVFWDGFHGHDTCQRLKMVHDVIAGVDPEASTRVLAFPVTPTEVREMDES